MYWHLFTFNPEWQILEVVTSTDGDNLRAVQSCNPEYTALMCSDSDNPQTLIDDARITAQGIMTESL